MKKIIFMLVLFALTNAVFTTARAEVVAKDTVALTKAWRLDKEVKTNDFGEVNVKYVCYVQVEMFSGELKEKKVPTSRVSYESGQITHVVFNVYDYGGRHMVKAINVDAERAEQQRKAAAKAAKKLAKAK